jgi:hypothetical protein
MNDAKVPAGTTDVLDQLATSMTDVACIELLKRAAHFEINMCRA